MKFFIRLGSKYGDHWELKCVYGPFTDDQAVENEIARLWPNNKIEQFLVFDGQIVNVKCSPMEKPESEKRDPGNTANYMNHGDVWKCKDCGATILYATVAHPVWERGVEGGFGECKYEKVRYCPNCETVPAFHGDPVYDD